MDKEDINQEYQLAKWINRHRGVYANIAASYAVRRVKRGENSYNLLKYCKKCNLFMGFRARKCWNCDSEDLEILRRHMILGRFSYRIEDGILRKINLEKFVNMFDEAL